MDNTAEEAIQKLLKKKNLNFQLGDSEDFVTNRIPFNIPALDKLTGGGIPLKKMTLINLVLLMPQQKLRQII